MGFDLQIKPKILVIMIIYLSLLFACNIAFTVDSTYEKEGQEFTMVESGSAKYQTEHLTAEQQQQQNAEETGWAGFFFTLPGIAVITYIVFGKQAGLIVGAVLTPVTTGLGYILGYTGIIVIPIYDIMDMIVSFLNHILNFILMLLDFLSFGVLDLSRNIPSIPYPFSLILFVLALPVGLTLLIWLVSVIMEGVQAIRG